MNVHRISTGFHSAAFLIDAEELDSEATVRKYAEIFRVEIEARFPGADIEIRHHDGESPRASTFVYVDGVNDPQLAEEVDRIAENILARGGFYVLPGGRLAHEMD